jgi:DNA-binding PadR family transcriptional regulator
MSTPTTLTATSYIVLGLLGFAGEATPYELKAGHAGSVGEFWSVPHSQLYAEPDRLLAAGLVSMRRERGGRRRKHYALTDAGREALEAWLAEAATPPAELREPALLKLFFGADPRAVAPVQLAQHRARLAAYEQTRANLAGQPRTEGPVLTLDAGIALQRTWIAYWERLAGA